MADEVHMEMNLRNHRQIVLGKDTLNSCLGCTMGAEDICLTSEGRDAESKGARGNPRGNKGNLVLNKEEKKKEGQSGHPLHIKYTATT